MDFEIKNVEEFTRERLMDDVRQYSCLYDKYCKDYQDKNVKNNAWAAVAAKYGISPVEAEKKYKTIRSSYTRYLKRKRNAAPGTRNAEGPTPIAFQNLDWLASHIDHKETSVKWTPNGGKNEGYYSEYSTLDGDDVYRGSYGELVREEGHTNGEVPLSAVRIDSPESSEPPASTPTTAVVQSSGGSNFDRSITMYYEKPKPESELPETVFNLKPMNSVQPPYPSATPKRKRTHESEDEDDLFCLSLAANLKRLGPRCKAIAKMRFQQVLFDLEFPATQSGSDS